MAQFQHLRPPILVAIPDAWRVVVCQIVQHFGFPMLLAQSHHEAVQLALTAELSGIIVISDWVVPSSDGINPGIVSLVKYRVPTITLVRMSNDFRWFDSAYERPHHEYFTIPFSAEQVAITMHSTGMLTQAELDASGLPDISDTVGART